MEHTHKSIHGTHGQVHHRTCAGPPWEHMPRTTYEGLPWKHMPWAIYASLLLEHKPRATYAGPPLAHMPRAIYQASLSTTCRRWKCFLTLLNTSFQDQNVSRTWTCVKLQCKFLYIIDDFLYTYLFSNYYLYTKWHNKVNICHTNMAGRGGHCTVWNGCPNFCLIHLKMVAVDSFKNLAILWAESPQICESMWVHPLMKASQYIT